MVNQIEASSLLLLPVFVLYVILWNPVQSEDICPINVSMLCNCSNGTIEVYCMGPALKAIPNYTANVKILHIDGADLDIVDNVIYPKLLTLYLEHSNIRYIKDNAFKNLSNLNFLYLRNNSITGLTGDTFSGLANLKTLLLTLNPVLELKSTVFSFDNTPRISEIKMDETRLFHIEHRAFSQLRELSYLNLSCNYLREVPYFHKLDELDSLHILDLSLNQIESLANSGLSNLKHLQMLSLHSNRIKTITHLDFTGQYLSASLSFVNLRYNQISLIEPTSLSGSRNLSQLWLDHNQLSYLPWEELPMKSLSKMTLSENPWYCGCNNSWMVEGIQRWLRVYNDNNKTLCATPLEVKNQPVFSVPMDIFKCPNPHHHAVKTSVLISVGLILSLLCIVGGAVLFLKISKKRRSEYNQPYTKVTANGGIHM